MRTFIAIGIDDAVRSRLAALQDDLRAASPRLRWTHPEQMHLTLKFLGDTDDEQVALIRDKLASLATVTTPFSLNIDETGVFPPSGAPRVVWVGVKDTAGDLRRCRDSVEQAIAPLGFPAEDRPFHPHLTLARCRDPRDGRAIREALQQNTGFDAGVTTVRQLVFFQSILVARGPIYTAISTHDLRGNPNPESP